MTRTALVFALLLGCAPCSSAPMELNRFEANFILTAYGTTIGRTEWRLVPIDNAQFLWESRSETAGAGALIRDVYITERSESQLYGQFFRPLFYQYDRYGEDTTRKVQVSFDWDNNLVLNTARDHSRRATSP